MFDSVYSECLKQATETQMRNGVGEGAVLYVFFERIGLRVFKNRSRPTRDFVKDIGLGYSGFQEHAEQAVINDAIAVAVANKDRIIGAMLFLGGYSDGKPYYYLDRTYICMNCAKYMIENLPLFNTFVYLPAENGWFMNSSFELYKMAVETYSNIDKPSDYRRERMGFNYVTEYTS